MPTDIRIETLDKNAFPQASTPDASQPSPAPPASARDFFVPAPALPQPAAGPVRSTFSDTTSTSTAPMPSTPQSSQRCQSSPR